MPVVLALPDLLVLAALIVAYGLIVFGDAFVRALFSALSFTVGWIPWVGGKADDAIKKASQAVSNNLGNAADKVGLAIAKSWNFLAAVVDRTGWAIWHTALAVQRVASYVTDPVWLAKQIIRTSPFVLAFKWLRAHAAQVTNVTTVIQKSIAHPVQSSIGAAIRVVTRPDTAALTKLRAWTTAQLKIVRQSIAHAGAQALPLPGTAVADLRDLLNRLRKRVARIETGKLGYIASAVFVATLARFGLNWLRCTNVKNAGRGVCRMDITALEDLLAGSTLIVGGISIVALTRELQDGMGFVSDAVTGFVREA